MLTTVRACSAALALSSLLACSSSQPDASTPSRAEPTIGVVTSDATGFDTHSWYLDTGKEVVVFDAQFTAAQAEQVIRTIRARTASPIRWLVVTHPNPDKFNGAPAFQAIGARVVASEATAAALPGVHAYKKAYFVESARMFTADTYPAQATIDVTFRGSYALPLEAGAVRLQELTHPGVSSTQTIAIASDAQALFVGDLVHHRAHAWLEGGIVGGQPRPDLAAWRSALDELRPFAGYTVHGGRGERAPVEVAVAEEQAYLTAMEQMVRDYVKALPDRAVLRGEQAGAHWKALAARAHEAYPSHALPYLIEYGVYGLALSM